jgi:plasmid stabilization system protein ParE
VDLQIIWTEPAVANLEAIVRHVAEDNPGAAEKLRLELLKTVEILAQFPFIGPAYQRDRSGRTREILCRRYRIFYRVQESANRVEILSVWHGSRQEPVLPE